MATINEQILQRIKNMYDEAVLVSSDFTDIAVSIQLDRYYHDRNRLERYSVF